MSDNAANQPRPQTMVEDLDSPPNVESVEAIRSGDPRAWQQVVEDLGPRLGGFARARGIDDPEDFVQDVLLAVARRIDRFDGDQAAFRSWVFSIAYRRAMDRHRVRYRTPEQLPLEEAPTPFTAETPESAMLADEDAKAAIAALDLLSPIERDVVTLRVLAELSTEEVAAIVGKRPGTVRVIQSRAVAKMRTHLEKQEKLRNAGVLAAMTEAYMRLLKSPYDDTWDPFSAHLIGRDPIAGWAAQLRRVLVTDVVPSKAAALAEAAAALVPVMTAASLATGAGVAAGSAIGGTTMTTATAAAQVTSAASSFLSVKNLIAALSASAVLTGGAAVTGNLADSAQTVAADLGARIGLELPRPVQFEMTENVQVGSAGTVQLGVRDGAISIVDVEGAAGWEVGSTTETDGGATIELTSDGAIATLSATIGATGEIVTEVITQGSAGEGGATAEGETEAGVGAEAGTDGSGGSAEAEAEAEVEIGIGLGG